MKILAFDCSAAPASCAVWEDGKILSSGYCNIKITHSQTLIPMATGVLSSALLNINDIDGFAVSCGPGSFTGVRIGLAAVKGMAIANNKPCYAVSTLSAMARRFSFYDCTVCALMDAKRNQFYNAIFKIKDKKMTRLCNDRAESLEAIEQELKNIDGKIILTGDGAELFANNSSLQKDKLVLPSPELLFQNAVGVAMEIPYTQPVNPNELSPVYLRMSQAERELKNKNK